LNQEKNKNVPFTLPEAGTEDISEGPLIDLNGNPLDPKYIVRIEKI